ncbi:hypothetical protein BsWGS_24288 [Bradybaena similaris]
MRRSKSGILNALGLVPNRGSPATVICYIVVVAAVLSNMLAICFFSVTVILDCQRNIVIASSERSQSPSTSPTLNEIITNVTRQGSEEMISLTVLLKVLQVFTGEDLHLRYSYVDAVLQYNNVSVDLHSLLEYYRQTSGTGVTNIVHGSHTFSAETKDLSDLHQRNSRQTANQHTFRIRNNTSLVNAPIKSSTSFSNHKSSLPKLIPSDRTFSSQAKKRDLATSVAPSNTSIAPQRNKLGIGNIQQRKHLPGTSVLNPHIVSCVNYSNNLTGRFKPTIQDKTPQQLISMFPKLQNGGRYTPPDCTPKENTAIIFPYRNRYSHLHILLLNIIPLLINQNIRFTLFIIEQDLPGMFNRAMLFNIGFLEALKVDNFDCFIFHDVDIIPINDYNFYHCNHQPTHFLSGVNKFKYKLMYPKMFGGVVAFTLEQFIKINGASNLYFGWGGEDDDLQIRVTNKGYKVIRKHDDIGLYDMIRHSRDNTNNANPLRKKMLQFTTERQDIEGLNTTIYTRKSVEMLPLYTWVKVAINMTRVLQTAPTSMNKLRDQLLTHFLPAEQNRTEV